MKYLGRSAYFEFDVYHGLAVKNEYKYIKELSALDLLSYPEIFVEKEASFVLGESSSGEYHLLASILGILAKIEKNSLILIDEPEISLHPNWQIRYVEFLKTIFKHYPNCHFIIASHSHLLVPSLMADTSSIISLSYNGDIGAELYDYDTYGWSSEDILYKIFNVKTFRNYYLDIDLRKLLKLISEKSKDKKTLSDILSRLIKIKLNESDPLNRVIEQAKDYIEKL
jgi:predicted ATP-dependent endonuclease of OLD family